MITRIPYVIVGAGIVGLQTAYRLLKSGVSPEEIVVFEQNIYPGEHSSARNSGVLHAGLYYPKDSLKQKFCLEGNQLWDEIATELDISINRCGKYIVATNESEITDIDELFKFATEKGVPGLEWGDANEIKEFVNVKKSFFSKSTGVVSVSEAIKGLSDFLFKVDVPVLLSQKVENLKKISNGFEFKVGSDQIQADYVINCGGHFGVDLRRSLGLNDLENLFVKGRYLKLNKKYFNDALIYPLPEKGLKGLGVHTSFDMDGIIRFGPDTFDTQNIDYQMEDDLLESMYPEIMKTFKNIVKDDLSPDYAGIRSKILKEGEIYQDFWIQSPLSGYIECLGIESPGFSASPAIAKHIVNKILN